MTILHERTGRIHRERRTATKLLRIAALMAAAFVCAASLPSGQAVAQDMTDWQRAALGMGPRGYAVGERSKGRLPRAVAEAGESEVGGKARRKGGRKVASLGGSYDVGEKPTSLSGGGGVRWVANAGCLDGSLKSVINQVAANYGPVTVSSTCRDHARNRRAGGAPKSYHLTGSAADFRVHSNAGAAYAYLRSSGSVGGLKHYGGGLFHIDTGPRRSF